MIMSFSYLIDLGDQDQAVIPDEFVQRLVRFNPVLRGLRTENCDGKMRVKLRIAGLTRWHIQRDAPILLRILLRHLNIPSENAVFESMLMEPGRSHLRNGQGRTEMTRRSRAERMADGRPWDHIAWEGDDISHAGQPDDSVG